MQQRWASHIAIMKACIEKYNFTSPFEKFESIWPSMKFIENSDWTRQIKRDQTWGEKNILSSSQPYSIKRLFQLW